MQAALGPIHADALIPKLRPCPDGDGPRDPRARPAQGLRRSRGGPRHRLRVAPGEVFGLLGPNGAGKTTTVEILEGYRARTSGIVCVLGHDPEHRPRDLRARVGIVLQSCGIYRHLTVREAVAHWAGLYPHPRDVDEVLELSGLTEKAGARARELSGGQLRRVDVALALVGDPELIFLDEPTTGFDPAARRQAWDVVRSLQGLGKTVLLTTHYLDEAQALCDRVAIVKDGRIVAEGPPAALGAGGAALPRLLARRGRRDPAPRDRGRDRAAAPAHERRARARRAAARPQRHPPDPRGRLPGAHERRGRRGGRRTWLTRSGWPGASTASSAGCSGATRAPRSSTSCCRCCSCSSSGRSSAAPRRTSTSSSRASRA